MDVRTGGTYRIVMHTPEEDMVVTGTYREVVPGRKLAMTWSWEEDPPAESYETLLTLEFNPHDGGTELILTHEQFVTETTRSNHENGWTSILDHLSQVL